MPTGVCVIYIAKGLHRRHRSTLLHHAAPRTHLGFPEGLVARKLGPAVVLEGRGKDLGRARGFLVDDKHLSRRKYPEKKARNVAFRASRPLRHLKRRAQDEDSADSYDTEMC